MKVSVQLNHQWRNATVVVAGEGDFVFVAEWQKTLGANKNPIRVDAVDFARISAHRFEAHSAIEHYAETVDDIGDHILSNPQVEVAGCALLTCDWFPESKVIGLIHFRRTWNNNVVLDYLTTHPYIAKPPQGFAHIIKGGGVALLYFLSSIARRYDCGRIWGEATATSCGFYKKAFDLPLVDDLISIPRDNFLAFIDRFDKKKGKEGDEMGLANPELEEVYVLEQNASPFVGSKTAVFNPRRRLAHRFLDLPYHLQMAVGSSLKLLQDEDKKEPATEQFRRLFQRAAEQGKLSDLWREVEKQHPDGEPETSPFPGS
jgi:hypothetical protein